MLALKFIASIAAGVLFAASLKHESVYLAIAAFAAFGVAVI